MMRRVNHDLIRRFYNNSVEAMKKVRDEFKISDMEWLDVKVLI